MKKIINIAMSAAVLLAGISCNKEISVETIQNPDQNAVEKVHMSFTAGLNTKAFISDGASVAVNWNDTDKIAVWDGTEWCEFSATSVDESTAVFEGDITPKGGFAITDFKAVYPYSAVTDKSSEAISISLPADQVVPDGKFVDPAALVAVATSDGSGLLSFTQVCSLVKVTLKLQNMSAITLEGTGFAGTVVCNDDGSIASSTARTDNITLTSATGTFPADAEDGTDYFVAVLPSSTALTVGITRASDGYTGSRTTASAVAFNQGKAKAWIKDSAITSWEYNISTPEQLVACAALWNEGFKSTVNLLADLDMSAVTLTGTRNFGGTFNGNDHKIYNLAIESDLDVCFIRNLVGEVNHLILGSSDGVNYDGTSALTIYDTETDSDWHYAAPIIRLKIGANVENVVNFIPVSVKAGTIVKTRIAGLIGVINTGPITVTNCTNYGNVSNNATSASAASLMAGIICEMDAIGTVENVINRGDITNNSNPYVSRVAGVVAYPFGGSSLSNCKNYGTITIGNLALSAASSAGGIFADNNNSLAYAEKLTISDCVNYGNLVVGTSSSQSLYIGGINGFLRNAELSNCDNFGSITSQHTNQHRLGGVSGSLHASTTISNCDNSGDISVTQAKANTGWQAIGGVVGFSESGSAHSFTNCSNSGNINATLNTTGNKYFRVSVGGIIGMPVSSATISNNTNRGSVTAKNNHASTPYCQVGGIIGSDSDQSGACTVSGNINYGTVTNNTSGDTYAFAGGLFGKLNYTTAVTSCKNFGSVVGASAKAGAVAGHNESATIAVTICNAVEVNGVTKPAASADEALWLCPSNKGTITPTYVAHDAGE